MIKKWIEAARPRTLPTSVSPVIAASAYAWYQNTFNGYAAAICLIFALLAQIASNFGNDYFDYKKGSDNSDRVGPRRAVASGDISPKSMLLATILTLALACVTGCLLIPIGGWKLLIAGIFIAIFAIAYSAGPYPLSYHGLGDIAVFIFFRTHSCQSFFLCPGALFRAASVSLQHSYGFIIGQYSHGQQLSG